MKRPEDMNNSWAALLNIPNNQVDVAQTEQFASTNFQPTVDAKAMIETGKTIRAGIDARDKRKQEEAEARKKRLFGTGNTEVKAPEADISTNVTARPTLKPSASPLNLNSKSPSTYSQAKQENYPKRR